MVAGAVLTIEKFPPSGRYTGVTSTTFVGVVPVPAAIGTAWVDTAMEVDTVVLLALARFDAFVGLTELDRIVGTVSRVRVVVGVVAVAGDVDSEGAGTRT